MAGGEKGQDMKAKSLSVFRTKLQRDAPDTVLVNIGDVIEGDDEHIQALARNRLVELLEGGTEKSATPTKPKAEPKPKPEVKPTPAAKQQKPKADAKAEQVEQANVEDDATPQGAQEDGEGNA